MPRRFALSCALALFALICGVSSAQAQAVLGPQDDALVLPRGVLRVRVLNQWTDFNQRYGANTPNRANGALEPLAIDFNLDTIGISEFPNLAPLQAGLRTLTGIPDFTLSLGKTVVNSNVSVIATPIVLEAGLTKRISMGLLIPYVRTRNTIFFNVNPASREGNTGFNPLLANDGAAKTRNQQLVTQFAAAAAQLTATLAACQANPGAPGCAAINAQRSNALALISNANAFAGGVKQLYGDSTTAGSPFIPIAGTDAAMAIDARTIAFDNLYTQFGVTSITSTGPTQAPARLTLPDAQRILTDPAFGVNASPLRTIERSHIGDIDLGIKASLWDTFDKAGTSRMTPSGLNYRLAAGAVFRFGTGQQDAPEDFVDIGTGNGQNDFELRGFGDILIGRNFWTSFIARYTWQMSDETEMRITDLPNKRLAAEYRQQKVERDLGDISEVEVNPRWVFNDYFSATGHYLKRFKREDKYTGTFNVDAATTGFADITLNAATLNQETVLHEDRLGFGVAFSTIAAFERAKAKLPMEITYFHFQTVNGSGGNVPKLFSDQVQVRIYARLFGGK
jgi:hypothetical protein